MPYSQALIVAGVTTARLWCRVPRYAQEIASSDCAVQSASLVVKQSKCFCRSEGVCPSSCACLSLHINILLDTRCVQILPALSGCTLAVDLSGKMSQSCPIRGAECKQSLLPCLRSFVHSPNACNSKQERSTSETSRKAFEEYIGMEVRNFPDDILAPGTTKLPDSYPPYLTKWLEFRVKTIYDFMVKARAAVKSVNPKIRFGVYVGGWYSSYYDVGVNWADQSYDPHLTYKWATKDYMKYGYADLMDQMLIGAYANPSNVYGTNEWTMQGFCMLAKAKAGNGCPLISGGPDVGNWNVGDLTQAQVQDAVTKSVDACINACDGYFVFDICHLRLHPEYWDCLQMGIFTFLANQK